MAKYNKPRGLNRLETLKWYKKHRCKKVRRRGYRYRKLRGKCWVFTGKLGLNGYACGTIDYVVKGLHVWSLEERLGRDLEPGELARHKCDNKACFNPNHLEPGSKADNWRDAAERGQAVVLKGSAHGHSKLTEKKVKKMRRLWNEGEYTQVELGRIYGVSSSVVSRIVNRKTWAHV